MKQGAGASAAVCRIGRAGTAVALSLALATAGCSKEKRAVPAAASSPVLPVAATDPLWAMAPDGTQVALVVGDGGLVHLQAALQAIVHAAETVEADAAVVAEMRRKLAELPVPILDASALAAAGIDVSRGAAVFAVGDDSVALLPVVDRAKFVAHLHGASRDDAGVPTDVFPWGVCRAAGDRYACSKTADLLGGVGKGRGLSGELGGWPATLRGAIELWVAPALTSGLPVGQLLADMQAVRGAIQLERGAFTARFQVAGKPSPSALESMGAAQSPLATAVRGKAAGVLRIPTSLLKLPLTMGMTPDQYGGLLPLLSSLSGQVLVWAPGGLLRAQLQVGLSDPAPARQLIAGCESLAALPGMTLHAAGDRCEASLPNPVTKLSGKTDMIAISARVDKDVLVIDIGDPAGAPTAVAAGPVGDDLVAGPWSVSMWGAGIFFGDPDMMQAASQAEANAPLSMSAIGHLNEIGLGFALRDGANGGAAGIDLLLRIRTLWANPDEVVAAVEPLLAAAANGDADARRKLDEIARKYPQSPFAADLPLGSAGPMVSLFVVGIAAAVAIPAFMKYVKASKTSEARDTLGQLHRRALAAYAEEQVDRKGKPQPRRFPGPSAGPTPPLGTCCAAGARCAPDPTLWAAAPWSSLGFSLDDSHYFSYEYRVAPDGQSFTARAYGDLDCDGEYSTYELAGTPTSGPAEPTAINALE